MSNCLFSKEGNMLVNLLLVFIINIEHSQQSTVSTELDVVVKTDPDTSFNYVLKHLDELLMKAHPYMNRVEVLNDYTMGDITYQERKYHEILRLPSSGETLTLHTLNKYDAKNKVITMDLNNEKPDTDPDSVKIRLIWKFHQHPNNDKYTLLTDVIIDEVSEEMKDATIKLQTKIHKEILKAIQEEAVLQKNDSS